MALDFSHSFVDSVSLTVLSFPRVYTEEILN